MSTDFKQLKLSFEDKSAKIGVIGLGYVGLPLCLTFAEKGFQTLGFDIDEIKIVSLMNGLSYISHIDSADISSFISSGQFTPTIDFARLSKMDAVLICVPTPLDKNREPDLSYVVSTGKKMAPHLKFGQLVVLESTTYPGTSTEILRPLLEKNGLKSGQDIYLAYSPEREDPGNPNFGTSNIPKVVGGDGKAAAELACTMYDQIVIKTIPVSSLEVAEAVKLTENIFRSVNIAMVNELKIIYDKMGIDIWEVIEAAKSKPFGFMPFYPGPGFGGHCIPIDPFYLTWRAKQFGQETRFIELAGEINTAMPNYVVDVFARELEARFEASIKGARILLIGLAYKKNVNDTRESPAFTLIELLEAKGAVMDYYDPYIPEILPTREHSKLVGRRSVKWSKKRIGSYDATLICTDHDAIDYDELVAHSQLVIDTRNATKDITEGREKVIKA